MLASKMAAFYSSIRRSISTMSPLPVSVLDHIPPLRPNSLLKAKNTPIQEEFAFEKEIGCGAYATVWQARCKATGDRTAVKILRKKLNPNYTQEVQCMQKVNHEFVVPLIDVFDTEESIMLVLPLYTGCDLFDYIDAAYSPGGEGVTEMDALVIAAQMLSAAEACHRSGVAHLDIKPENFMFAEKDVGSDLVLVDFGSAEEFTLAPYAATSADYDPELDDVLPLDKLHRVGGTANYLSPEVADGRFSSRSDVFSVGVTLYSLLTGLSPFRTAQIEDYAEQICHLAVVPKFDKNEWEHVSSQCIDTIKWMLRPDPQLRCSTSEALTAITTVLDILESRDKVQKAFDRFSKTAEQSIQFRRALVDNMTDMSSEKTNGKKSLYETGSYGSNFSSKKNDTKKNDTVDKNKSSDDDEKLDIETDTYKNDHSEVTSQSDSYNRINMNEKKLKESQKKISDRKIIGAANKKSRKERQRRTVKKVNSFLKCSESIDNDRVK